MRWKYERDYVAANRCCFCCHIRTGTLIFGLVQLVVQAVIAAVLVAFIIRPDFISYILPVKHSVLISSPSVSTIPANNETAVLASDTKPHFYGNGNLIEADNLMVGIMFTVGLIGVTISLVYGVIRGEPKYMMPFFCIQLLDICITGMTMLSYFTSVEELKRWISQQDYLPDKQMVMRLNDDFLMVLTLVIFVAVIFYKMYFIGVVWNCYKYLQHYARIGNQPSYRRYNTDILDNGDDAELLLPPKYEDVILMPNTQSAADSPPPPAYSDE